MLWTLSSSLREDGEDEKKNPAMGSAEESLFRVLHRVMGRHFPVDGREKRSKTERADEHFIEKGSKRCLVRKGVTVVIEG